MPIMITTQVASFSVPSDSSQIFRTESRRLQFLLHDYTDLHTGKIFHIKCHRKGSGIELFGHRLHASPARYRQLCNRSHWVCDFRYSRNWLDSKLPSASYLSSGARKIKFGLKPCEPYVRNGDKSPFVGKTLFVRSFEEDAVASADDTAVRNTLRLVECAVFAASAGLAYFLSTLLRLENYFGCFFPLPIVVASMRWGAYAGRKTMVATAILLLVLSGPLRAASYLLMHGFVGLAMGALWRWKTSWGLSIIICTVVRSIGALGFVGLSSWLLRDNILALITINAHASVCYMLAAFGMNMVPTMGMIYVIFATLLLVNCGSFVFLLHVLYAIFLHRLGMNVSISIPAWVERAF